MNDLNELFAVEPTKNFRFIRLGYFKDVNINMKTGNHEFYGHDHFAVRSISEISLVDCMFSLKKEVFFIGEVESIKMVEGLKTYFFMPASPEDMKKGIEKIKK